MKLPRVRISTLMLLVLIAALAVALVAERRRSKAALIAEQQRSADRYAKVDVERAVFRTKYIKAMKAMYREQGPRKQASMGISPPASPPATTGQGTP